MNILGINCFFEHPAAALLVNGQLVFAIEDERLTRVKHGKRYTPYSTYVPYASICAGLRHAGLRAADIDEVTVSYSASHHLRSLGGCWTGRRLSSFSEELAAWRAAANLKQALRNNHELPHFFRDVWRPGELTAPYCEWDHHLSHAASAFFYSGFDDALVVVADGSGEDACTSVYEGQGSQLRLVDRICLPHSLGFLYSFVTRHLGFEPFSDEYKVMGLAAYGEPAFAKSFDEIVRMENGSRYRVDLEKLKNLKPLLGPARHVGEEITQAHKDVARSLQAKLERVLEQLIGHHLQTSQSRNLCVAGGVFLNCVANGKLAAMSNVDGFFAQPAAHDAGTALGAAALSWIRNGGTPQIQYESMLLGTAWNDAKVEAILRESVFAYEWVDPERLPGRIVEMLAEERVVALFRDRMEFGPRSLGARSFIASPRSARTREKLNRIKGREQFRPLAPAVLEKSFSRFFEGIPNRYMMLAVKAREETQKLAPAIVHGDGTSRVQVVRENEDPYFHRLLSLFEEKTGVPILINTSLNTRGKPIDESPVNALNSACSLGVDALVLGNHLVVFSSRPDIH